MICEQCNLGTLHRILLYLDILDTYSCILVNHCCCSLDGGELCAAVCCEPGSVTAFVPAVYNIRRWTANDYPLRLTPSTPTSTPSPLHSKQPQNGRRWNNSNRLLRAPAALFGRHPAAIYIIPGELARWGALPPPPNPRRRLQTLNFRVSLLS